ncbi:unnamed protein product [Pleuronectes platessa]|uniref:Uncharacterized protein n=1 Tax=Pleuronectes platessa TaxID=8262 RepID=A0A9N7UCY1_PLEPL|nr:unnamed protein product [Pleuronectes platessa]
MGENLSSAFDPSGEHSRTDDSDEPDVGGVRCLAQEHLDSGAGRVLLDFFGQIQVLSIQPSHYSTLMLRAHPLPSDMTDRFSELEPFHTAHRGKLQGAAPQLKIYDITSENCPPLDHPDL